MADLTHISTWVFDLDNTLYPAGCNLFAQVDQRMAAYIAKELDLPLAHARFVQKDYYKRFGTTLTGLMKLHGLKPEPFLKYVHDIDVTMVEAAPELSKAIAALPGRKFIYTNGSRHHAERIADQLGVLNHFEDITDIASNNYCAKPDKKAYQSFLKHHAIAPSSATMFEDMPHNLEAPHALGMVTILVQSDYMDHPVQKEIKRWTRLPEHIHHQTDDLTGFLKTSLNRQATTKSALHNKTTCQ